MEVKTYYQATDEHGRPTGKLAPTKLLSWGIFAGLIVLWGIYLAHLGHGHEAVLSVGELGAISVVGAILMAALYYAGRQMGEIGAQAVERRFGNGEE